MNLVCRFSTERAQVRLLAGVLAGAERSGSERRLELIGLQASRIAQAPTQKSKQLF